MTLGEKLSKLRKENNYTQEQLADILGVSRQAISKWESNITYPETDKLIRMSELFDCSLDYLLKDAEETGRNNQSNSNEEILFFRKRLWGMPLWHIGRNANTHGQIKTAHIRKFTIIYAAEISRSEVITATTKHPCVKLTLSHL